MAEISALSLPTIFVPSPYVTNNHQFKNANVLVEKNAGLLIEEKDLKIDNLINKIDDILSNKKEYDKIKKNLGNLGIKDSSDRIYDLLKDITK